MSEIMDAYWRQPPFARNLATAVVVTSLAVHFHFLPYAWFYFHVSRIFMIPPEIWRPITTFLISGPKIGIIMDPYFLFQYLSQIEAGNPRFPRKEDVLWYLICVSTMIIVLAHYFTGDLYLLQGLILALCYTNHQDQRGQQAMFFFFRVPAQAMPYCMIIASLLMSPGAVPLQIAGLVSAHLYDFLTRLYPEFGGGRNLLPTPRFMSWFVQTPRILQRAYGTAIRNESGGASGASSGGSVLPDSWKTRGSGHRLG